MIINNINRTKEMASKYQAYMQDMQDNKKKPFKDNVVVSHLISKNKQKIATLYKNMFPYDRLGYTEDTHLILCVFNKKIKIDEVKKVFKNYIVHENSRKEQSIPEIRHFHLFERGKGNWK